MGVPTCEGVSVFPIRNEGCNVTLITWNSFEAKGNATNSLPTLALIYCDSLVRLTDSSLDEVCHDHCNKLQQVPTFYTDGSCPFPQLADRSLCTWSVVRDSLDDDVERSHIASLVKDRGIIPESLVPIQASLVQGPQTVNRAELTAILQIVRSVECAVIHSDSAWAISAFESVREAPFSELHASKPNSDLLLGLCELTKERDLTAFDLRKMKSHLCVNDVITFTFTRLYHILGNRLADRVAAQAALPSRSPLHAASGEVAEWYTKMLETLKNLSPFFVQSYTRRLDAFQ